MSTTSDNIVTGTLVTIVTNIATILTTLVTIFFLDWRLSLIAIAVIPLMILPLSPVGQRMYVIRRKTREKRDEIESITQETLSISGITLIKSFVREQFERNRFFKVANDLMQLEIDLAMVGRWFIMVIGAMVRHRSRNRLVRRIVARHQRLADHRYHRRVRRLPRPSLRRARRRSRACRYR